MLNSVIPTPGTDGKTYDVPRAITVIPGGFDGETFHTFSFREEVVAKLIAEPGLIPTLFSIGGEGEDEGEVQVSVLEAVSASLRPETQYAFYSFRSSQYIAALRDFDSLLNTDLLLEAIRPLPSFDPENQSTVEVYRKFFRSFGSHIVTSVEYGASLRNVSLLWANPREYALTLYFRNADHLGVGRK